MRTLSANLLAAQKARTGTPYVECVVSDYRAEVQRVRWTRWYTGADTPRPVAAAVADDGALIRVRNDAGTLYASRVASPSSGSTWTSWTAVETVFSGSGCAVVRKANGDLWMFYVETNHTTIEVKVSTDDGASWGTGTAIIAAGGDKDFLTAAVSGNDDDVVLMWNEGAGVYFSRHNGTSWSARAAWTHTIGSCTGLALTWTDGDFGLMVSGTEDTTLKPKVWALRFGDGFAASEDAWGGLRDVTEASADSDVTFGQPTVVTAGAHHCFVVESFGGDLAYDRLQYFTKLSAFDFNTVGWQDPLAFDYEGSVYGAAVCETPGLGGELYLVAADGVWHGEFLAPGVASDLSARVVFCEASVDEGGARGRVELDNADGSLSAYGTGALTWLGQGSRVVLNPGYVTASGNEVNTLYDYTYWVERCELVTGARPRLVLHLRGAEWFLERWRARRHFEFSGTLAVTLYLICNLAGLSASAVGGGGSTALTTLTPGYAVQPGERGLAAVRRLMDGVPDLWFFIDGHLVYFESADDDASVYAFGGDHAILEGRYGRGVPAINRARTYGEGVVGEAFDFDGLQLMGEALDVAADRRLDDSGDAADRAAAQLRRAQLVADEDEVDVPVHCGVELYDVVDVTDAGAGLSAAARRVRGYRWVLDRVRGRYEMTLRLGAV